MSFAEPRLLHREIVSNVPNTTEIQRILEVYGYSASVEYAEKTRTYIEMLLRWNNKVALTAVTAPEELVRFHFGESLFGMIAAGMQNGRLADLGSGAGFPGTPIAMAKPGLKVTLVESNGKKAAFLSEIRRELRLNNVIVQHGRAEDVPRGEQFEFVTARALGNHSKWLNGSTGRTVPGGKIALWVNSAAGGEITQCQGWKWAQPAKIPATKDRFVVIGTREV